MKAYGTHIRGSYYGEDTDPVNQSVYRWPKENEQITQKAVTYKNPSRNMPIS